MSSSDRFFELLPAALRARDAEMGGPLRALAAIISDEIRAVEADVETTWDNWFIETCEEWLVPYIGDALGVRGLRDVDAAGFSTRAYVANALERRRRKGTIAATEELARDVTGYPARAVEMFSLTATNVNVNHTRMPAGPDRRLGTVDVRDRAALDTVGTAFDPYVHTPDVRPVGGNRVRHNLANIAVHLWRTQIHRVSGASARVDPADPRRFRFDPLGRDRVLFSAPVGESSTGSMAGPEHVPRPLGRFELVDADPATLPFAVRTVTDGTDPVPLTAHICDLSDNAGALPARQPSAAGEVLVDPELGRLALHPDDLPAPGQSFEVLVDHAIAWPGRLGAGAYDRNALLARQLDGRAVTFQRGVTRSEPIGPGDPLDADLQAAVVAWNAHVAALAPEDRADAVGVLALLDSRTYEAPSSVIEVPDGATLCLVAARWLETEEGGVPTRHVGDVDANGVRAHLTGTVRVHGTSDTTAGGLVVNGLLVEGAIAVETGNLRRLDVAASTITGPATSIGVTVDDTGTNGGLAVRIDRSITGRVAAGGPMASVLVTDSFVGAPLHAIDVHGTALELRSSTTRGAIRCHVLDATDSILDEGDTPAPDALRVTHTQEGCIRFSYAPIGATTPRRYRCQPDLALDGITDPIEQERIISVMRPTSTFDLGDRAFGLLGPEVPDALRTAASDGSEPGMWHHLQHARRLANLRMALRHDLRFGLDVGVVLDT